VSIQDPNTYVEWLSGLPIPWLTNTNGLNELQSYGSVLDGGVVTLNEAVKARFPDYAATDALAAIGNDRLLLRGPSESDSNYATRLKYAWDDWERAGTFLELLVQLYWTGFEGAVIAQQNGLVFSLSAAPTAGEDPAPLLQVATPTTINSLTSMTSPTQPVVPAGSNWWTIDQSTEFGSRFVVLLPTGATWLMTYGTATFSSASEAMLTWNKPLESGLSYSYIIGNPTITDGSGGVTVSMDPSTVTTTGASVNASDAFSGSVVVIAFPTGTNPFFNLSATGLGVLQSVIRTWRPARGTCVDVIAWQQGRVWGYPTTLNWGSGTWGGTVIKLSGSWI
jgi:hypothetical protein